MIAPGFSLVLRILVALVFTAFLIGGAIKSQPSNGEIKIKDKNGKQAVLYKESHALVIWAGNYQSWSKLNNVEEEAQKITEALKDQGFQVTIVGNPTSDVFSTSIQDFIANYGYKKDNRLLIFYTGHGNTRNNRGYLVPVDAPDPIANETGFLKRAISMERVMTWAREIESKHVLFVFDSCFSGTVFKTKSRPKLDDSYIRTITNKPVRQFLTAGDAGEEVPAKSIFTPLFIRAIKGEADLLKDGYVTGSELGIYLTQKLREYPQNRQSPQYGKIRDPDLDQGDIVFRVPNTSFSKSSDDSSIKIDSKLIATLTGHQDHVNSVNFSPDGKILASGSSDNNIKLWNMVEGKLITTLVGHQDHVFSAKFSSDGKTLASGGDDNTIKLWNIAEGKLMTTLIGHSDRVKNVSFSKDNQLLASGSADGTIKLWNMTTGKLITTLMGHQDAVNSVSFSPDSKILASGSLDKTVKLWNVTQGKLITTLTGHLDGINSVSFSPDGKTLASGSIDTTLKLWNMLDNEEVHTFTGHKARIISISFSPDGKILTSGSLDKTIKFWNVAEGKEIHTITGHEESVWCVSFSPDGKTLASGSLDKTIKLWDLKIISP